MKKDISFVRDETCQKAFKDIKESLMKPLILLAPVSEMLFLFYMWAMDHSLGTLLEQKNEKASNRPSTI